ncbi:hypothetical protein [Spirosoma linguale]|uniref:DUF4468 domain-containing protein n=1 Tax=Spirosoma linguale (strain ATCC 33905 / DSM 74 / LMG 10896 / Claus 1) TaxID=504472 RepID=D2QC24_SPILD|nr:hypothetical protein Slin_3763 [Spirosoma linguale DSM 74]
MKTSIKSGLAVAFTFLMFAALQPAQAQTLAKNGQWLEKQFDQLIKDKKDNEAPKFTFKGCQMNMDLDTKDKEVSVGMHMGWLLSDVRKISYKKEKNGQYTLLLDVPADKVKMAMNVGGFGGSFNQDSKDKHNKDNTTSLNLSTTDESLVRQIKQKLEESVQFCQQSKVN